MCRKMFQCVFVSLAVSVLAGCAGPYKVVQFEEIGPNETAFVIPLEGETKGGQATLKSVEFLESNKVVAKRITIPQRQHDLGRTAGDYEWIPTVRVIKVDRTPVTREWTKGHESGTSAKNEAIGVESLDSINFRAGVNITCSIQEPDAAKFLYYFAGKPLTDVVDSNVRGYIQTILSREFGVIMLTECPKKKGEVFKTAFEEAKTFFAEKGLTVEYMGSSEGLLYDNPQIQDAINKKFLAENDIEVARQEKLAQVERNMMAIEKAKAEAEAAQALSDAREALTLRTELEVKRITAEATKTAAQRWNGSVPSNILPQGSNLLFGLDAPRSTK